MCMCVIFMAILVGRIDMVPNCLSPNHTLSPTIPLACKGSGSFETIPGQLVIAVFCIVLLIMY